MIPFGYFRVPRGSNLWLGITYELAKFPSHPLAQDFDLLLLIYSSRFCYFSYTLFRVFIFVFRLISYYHKRFKNARLLSTNFIVFFTTLAISPLLSHLNTYVVFYTTYLYKRPINFPPKFCHKYPVITKGHFNFLLKNAAFRPLYNFMCLLFFLFELFVL